MSKVSRRHRQTKAIKGLTSGSKVARTAWIQYKFGTGWARIQIYRYGWVVYDDTVPQEKFASAKHRAEKWAKDCGFWYIRERVTLELTYDLKSQDGSKLH